MTTIHIPPGAIIDPYLKAHRQDTRFVLGTGIYTSEGGWAFDQEFDHVVLGPGCELRGAGSLETFLHFVQPSRLPAGARQIECLTIGERSTARPMRWPSTVSGVTIRLPRVEAPVGLVGVHAWSDSVEISDVVVEGVTGNRAAGNEGFGILINGAGRPRAGGGSIVRNCRVIASGGYVCGLYVGYDSPTRPSFVQQCTVENLWTDAAHAAFGSNGRVFWAQCENIGAWDRAVFCDTGGGSGILFNQCHLRAERVLVEFRGGNGITWRDITVTGCLLETTPCHSRTYAGALVLARDGQSPGATADNVRIVASTLRSSGGVHYIGSNDLQRSSGVGIQHCVCTGGKWDTPVVGEGSQFDVA